MPIAREIPRRLRKRAVALPDLDDDEAAWSRDDALEVIDALRGTMVAVSGVQVFFPVPGGYAPGVRSWQAHRVRGELESDFVGRSHDGARAFVEATDDANGTCLFALMVPMWKDAA